MLDILALAGLDWLYDRIEDRYGSRAAWLVIFAAGVGILGIAVWILFVIATR